VSLVDLYPLFLKSSNGAGEYEPIRCLALDARRPSSYSAFAFAPYTPIFSISPVTSSTSFRIAFLYTTDRDFKAPKPAGLVKSLAIASAAGAPGTLVQVDLKSPATIRVLRDGENLNVELTATQSSPNVIGRSANMATEAAPAAFRVILLKYADVSEIAGVLGPENLNVAPADSFAATTVFGSPQGTTVQSGGARLSRRRPRSP
jgi:hypothetical protein